MSRLRRPARHQAGRRARSPGGGKRARGPAANQGRSVPLPLLLPALAAVAFLVLPLLALLLRAPWRRMPALLLDVRVLDALLLSLWSATLAAGASLVLGVPLAWLLARTSFRGRGLVRALVTVPLVLPPVVGGIALLLVLGRTGLVGRWLEEWWGFSLPFTTAGVVVAETFVAMPFLVLAVEGALRGADRRYEEVAATLGASPWLSFRLITLPIVAPGVLAGLVLAWARALGEFGATITFAGNLPGTTQTMPLAIYLRRSSDPDAALVLSLLLLAVSLTVLAGLRGRWAVGQR